MINPREVDDVIAALSRVGWPPPIVDSAHFNADGTGPKAIWLRWPERQCQANYETGRGWTSLYTPMRQRAMMPFAGGSIDSRIVIDDLLLSVAREAALPGCYSAEESP